MEASTSVLDDGGAGRPGLYWRLMRVIKCASYMWCVVGGMILLGALAVTFASVLGRMLAGMDIGLGAFIGDNEIMEAGCAVAAFAFLPWCQIKHGHVAVDVFVSYASPRIQAILASGADLLMLGVALVIAWRLGANMLELRAHEQSTMLLRMPLWLIYLGCIVGCVLFVLACLATLSDRLDNRKGDSMKGEPK